MIEELKAKLATASPMFKRILQSRIEKLEFDASPIEGYVSYLKSVYSFKDGKVFSRGYYHDIELMDEHNFLRSLEWKYPKITKTDLAAILLSLK
jgi:hypothetical protein